MGSGGVRPCSLAFDADQIDNKYNPNNKRVLGCFIGWYYATATFGVLVAFTGVVYIQDHAGWKVSFGVPSILMFVASSLYVKTKVKKSIFTSFVQVVIVAYKYSKIVARPSNRWHHHQDSSIAPTKRLRQQVLEKITLFQLLNFLVSCYTKGSLPIFRLI